MARDLPLVSRKLAGGVAMRLVIVGWRRWLVVLCVWGTSSWALSEVLSKDAQVEKADLLLNGRDLGKSEAEMRDWGTALANSEAHVTIRLWTRLLRACGIYIDARPLVVETDGTMDVGKGLWASLEQSEGRQVWRVVDVGASLGRFTDPTIVDRDVTW